MRKTLEPLLTAMKARTAVREPTSKQILNLKVCDPAMGSGAFLVAACRYLADQVVAAWTREGQQTRCLRGRGRDRPGAPARGPALPVRR